jgi:hypothetical protein
MVAPCRSGLHQRSQIVAFAQRQRRLGRQALCQTKRPEGLPHRLTYRSDSRVPIGDILADVECNPSAAWRACARPLHVAWSTQGLGASALGPKNPTLSTG